MIERKPKKKCGMTHPPAPSAPKRTVVSPGHRADEHEGLPKESRQRQHASDSRTQRPMQERGREGRAVGVSGRHGQRGRHTQIKEGRQKERDTDGVRGGAGDEHMASSPTTERFGAVASRHAPVVKGAVRWLWTERGASGSVRHAWRWVSRGFRRVAQRVARAVDGSNRR